MGRNRETYPSIKIEASGWPDELTSGLFVQWCLKLSMEDLNITQWGSYPNRGHRFGDPAGSHFAIEPLDHLTWKVAEVAGFERDQIRALTAEAKRRTRNKDTGDDVAYQAELISPHPPLDASLGLNIDRILSEHLRFSGLQRLSHSALLDFTEDDPPTPDPLFSPDIRIKATIFVPGPAPGDLANSAASSMVEIVAAICAFALGRPVNCPPIVFPMYAEESRSAFVQREDETIPGLARNDVSLDIFGELSTLGDLEATTRAGNAFVTLHHAQRQSSADIATMLYICAIEALIVPQPERSWAKSRVVARFRDGLLALCASKVEELLANPNLEVAFAYKKRGQIARQLRDLTERVYELRSLPTHMGIGPMGTYMGFAHSDLSIRAALLSDLARAALLSYIQAPRSFLTGMPGIDPKVELE